jgi:hypothetical protein
MWGTTTRRTATSSTTQKLQQPLDKVSNSTAGDATGDTSRRAIEACASIVQQTLLLASKTAEKSNQHAFPWH